jgi:hypothetical protein
VDGARKAEGVIDERAPEGISVLDGVIDAGRGSSKVRY